MLSYNQLLEEIEMLCSHGVEVGSIGNSTMGQRIPYIFVGDKGGKCLIVQCAIHAREHITSLLGLCMAKHLLVGKRLEGGVYIVPMVNVDGVRLCQEGLGWIEDKTIKSNLIAINGGTDFAMWKANIRGVDLNVNFDAMWGKGDNNQYYKGDSNYIGQYPLSEKESRALVDFTLAVNPIATLSYHSKGEVVYWQFGQEQARLDRDRHYADAIASHTGYTLVDGQGSVGGYKDWCIDSLGIPSYTIEVGDDSLSHPLPYSEIQSILDKNIDVPRRLLNSLVRDNVTRPD